MTGGQLPESCRVRVLGTTPDGDPCSILVLRLGDGRDALVALSFYGVRTTTALFGQADAIELLEGLADAMRLTAEQRAELAERLAVEQ